MDFFITFSFCCQCKWFLFIFFLRFERKMKLHPLKKKGKKSFFDGSFHENFWKSNSLSSRTISNLIESVKRLSFISLFLQSKIPSNDHRICIKFSGPPSFAYFVPCLCFLSPKRKICWKKNSQITEKKTRSS